MNNTWQDQNTLLEPKYKSLSFAEHISRIQHTVSTQICIYNQIFPVDYIFLDVLSVHVVWAQLSICNGDMSLVLVRIMAHICTCFSILEWVTTSPQSLGQMNVRLSMILSTSGTLITVSGSTGVVSFTFQFHRPITFKYNLVFGQG